MGRGNISIYTKSVLLAVSVSLSAFSVFKGIHTVAPHLPLIAFMVLVGAERFFLFQEATHEDKKLKEEIQAIVDAQDKKFEDFKNKIEEVDKSFDNKVIQLANKVKMLQ